MKNEETITSNTMAPILRPMSFKKKKKLKKAKAPLKMKEAAQILTANDIPVQLPNGIERQKHVMRVVLITEGLGNRVNMNYYSPEAIGTAPAIFEGKSAFFDHPSDSEARDIPERRVRQKFGYFKNCKLESIGGLRACTGDLHFDLSDDGEQAFLKSCSALNYRDDFPGVDSEYVGLSIHADGDWEDRSIQWEGENIQVKYVTRFSDAVSCDLVTSPARGGRILALVESAAGAIPTQEVGSMQKKLKALMEAARTALKKADEEKDPATKNTLVSEARKLSDSFLLEASKAAHTEESQEAETEESETEETTTTETTEAKAEAEEADMDEAKKDEADDAAPKKKKKKVAAKDNADDEDDSNIEANRIAIASLLKESGVIHGPKRKAQLEKLPLKEARVEIEMLAEDQKLLTKNVLKQMQVTPANFSKLTESERESSGDAENNNHLFADCYR